MASQQNARKQPPNRLRPAVHEMIGHRLRLHYDELYEQPLPTHLLDLMRMLDDDGVDEPAEPRRN